MQNRKGDRNRPYTPLTYLCTCTKHTHSSYLQSKMRPLLFGYQFLILMYLKKHAVGKHYHYANFWEILMSSKWVWHMLNSWNLVDICRWSADGENLDWLRFVYNDWCDEAWGRRNNTGVIHDLQGRPSFTFAHAQHMNNSVMVTFTRRQFFHVGRLTFNQ